MARSFLSRSDHTAQEDALSARLVTLDAPRVESIVLRKQSHNAIVFQGFIDGAKVFIKSYQVENGPKWTRATVDETAVVSAQMEGSPDAVVPVIWSHEDDGIVIMGAAAGEPLVDVLSYGDAALALQHVARWLRSYAGPRIVQDQFSTGFWMKQRLAADLSPLSQSDRTLALALLSRQQARAEVCGTLPAWKADLPRDFAPHNLHWTGEGIVGFDNEGHQHGAILRAIVWFAVLAQKRLPASEDTRLGLQNIVLDPLLAAFDDHADTPDLLSFMVGDLLLARLIHRHDDRLTGPVMRRAIQAHLAAD